MKKIIYGFALFLFMPALSYGWGMMWDYRYPDSKYLLKDISKGVATINYCVEPALENYAYVPDAEALLNRWFSSTASYIKNTARGHEFAKDLKFFDKKIIFNKVACPVKHGDIKMLEKVTYTSEGPMAILRLDVSEYCTTKRNSVLGLRSVHDGEPYTVCFGKGPLNRANKTGDTASIEADTMYALGMILGLAPQHNQGPEDLSMSDVNYSTDFAQPSLMAFSDRAQNSTKGKLYCDDAEGMLALYEFTVKDFTGGDVGWLSICDAKRHYIKSIQQNKAQDTPLKEAHRKKNLKIYKTVKDGQKQDYNRMKKSLEFSGMSKENTESLLNYYKERQELELQFHEKNTK
ncbi:hypothetical protein Dip510_001771 [Elusimicrobium posterum]|uniref:hypothetical protein n=1 Tax=Elusimicrobium posterum TaxID=3116653 RepID=UPI003C776B97